MGLQFFPRGSSAHIARRLAQALPGVGWDVRLVCGSLSPPGRPGDARAFYRGLDVRPLDLGDALAAPDPMRADPPMHPSYEHRPGAPDRVMSSLDPGEHEHQVAAWARALADAGAAGADVLHLHHLTPLNEAAERVAPDVPVVGHLHGTELLMLESIEEQGHRNCPYAWEWGERLRAWAAGCRSLIVRFESEVARVTDVLDVEPGRCVTVPVGVDPETAVPRVVDRPAHWRRRLAEVPRGAGEVTSPVAYGERDLEAFAEGNPVLVSVGRFTAVNRLPLLIEAYERARPGFIRRAPLVLVGGFPGEWEGEHPLAAIGRLGARDVFLAGWRDESPPACLGASDAVAMPSARDHVGPALLGAMACGLPPIAVDGPGASAFVRHGESGWLVDPDDPVSLANALVEAVNRPAERARRGANARARALAQPGWPALARRVAGVYEAARHAGDPGGVLAGA
jgi:glycosyltransferase involved in cell wall biosynthesis